MTTAATAGNPAPLDIVSIGEPMVEFNQTDPGAPRYLQGFGGDTSNMVIAAARPWGEISAAAVATIDHAPEGVRLALRSSQAIEWPASLELRIVHATRAEQDRLLVLRSIGGGHYVAGGESLPQAGRWTVQLAAAAGDWRLASPVDAGASTWRIEARPGGVQ